MFTHIFRQDTKTDTGEVVDGKPRIAWVVQREETLETRLENLIRHLRPQLWQAKVLSEILEENLDKDTTARCRFLLVHMDDRHHMPANRVGAEHMTKEAGDVAKPVRLVSVDRVVVFGKRSLEQVRPETIDLGKPFPNQPIELRVCALLRATLDDHGWEFRLQARR